MTTTAGRRAVVEAARGSHAGLSERRACRFFGYALASQRYRSRRAPEAELRTRLHELELERVRWGYRRLHVLLRREGRAVAAYRDDYNHVRPHSPLGKRTPKEFASTLRSLDLGVAVA